MRAVRNGTTGAIVAPRVRRAVTPWSRALGYLGRRSVDPAEGLWFDRCPAVHTIGLRATIDVVFLDAEHTVVRVVSRARRNRILRGGARAAATLELAAGAAAALRPGDRLVFE